MNLRNWLSLLRSPSPEERARVEWAAAEAITTWHASTVKPTLSEETRAAARASAGKLFVDPDLELFKIARMPEPQGYREAVISYRVDQITSAPDHALDKVIERFRREVELQFGSSVDINVISVDNSDWWPGV